MHKGTCTIAVPSTAMPFARSSAWRRTGLCQAPHPERAEPMIPIRRRSRSAQSSTRRMITRPRQNDTFANLVQMNPYYVQIVWCIVLFDDWPTPDLLVLLWFGSGDKDMLCSLVLHTLSIYESWSVDEICIGAIKYAQNDNSTQTEWISKKKLRISKKSHSECIILLLSLYDSQDPIKICLFLCQTLYRDSTFWREIFIETMNAQNDNLMQTEWVSGILPLCL